MEQIQGLYQATLGWLINIVLVTDPGATYANPAVQHLWQIALAITDMLGVIFLIFTGYQILFSGYSAQYGVELRLLSPAAKYKCPHWEFLKCRFSH